MASAAGPALSPSPSLIHRYIGIAEDFIGRCDNLAVPGAQKLKKKIMAELKFLQTLAGKPHFQGGHLSSSNLGHFAAMLHTLETIPTPHCAIKPFSFPGRESLPVDVVACQGHLWVKVIARKAQALHLVWAGRGQFGERTLLDQASEYLQLARLHQINFRTPKLCYAFYNGVTDSMAAALEHLGIVVCGEVVAVSSEVETKLQSVYVFSESDVDASDSDSDSECFLRSAVLEDSCARDASAKSVPDQCINISTTLFSNSNQKTCTCFPIHQGTSSSDNKVECTGSGKNVECTVNDNKVEWTGSGNNVEFTGTDNKVECSGSDKKVECCGSDNKVGSSSCDNNVRCTGSENIDQHTACKVVEFSSSHNNVECTEMVQSENTDRSSSTCASGLSTTDASTVRTETDISGIQGQDSLSSSSSENSQHLTHKLQNFCIHGDKSKVSRNYYYFDGDVMSHYLERICASPGLDHPEITDHCSPSLRPIPVRKVNLDVTALIALISNITHGSCHFVFEEKVLTAQAAEERRYPVLPKMEKFIQGKDLFACQTAMRAFSDILHTLGGLREKTRAAELMSSVTVVPDQPSSRSLRLPSSAKIKDRSKVIFGTGDAMEMVTLTANSGFIRAAENQGVTFTVFIHAARALTEEKECKATAIEVETGEIIN